MAIPESNTPKSQLRKHMRRDFHGGSRDSKSICEAVCQWLAGHRDLTTISVFAAIPGEVDLSDAVARHPELRWVYPKVDRDHLTFHIVRDPASDLTPGAFGILEPAPTLAQVPIDQIDAFLCPGIAFDPHGGRLGRGRGFYDRMLANARPDALKIGVCFADQIVGDTHAEAHDIRMDLVISA